MKFSIILQPLLLAAVANAQGWCAIALNQCIQDNNNLTQAVNDLQSELDSHLAYRPINCPGDNTQLRAGEDQIWRVRCGSTSGRAPDYTRTTSDMYDCLEACDETTQCSSGAYNPSTQECRLWDTTDPGWSNSADFDGFFHIGRVN
ncbi:hypothetical protein ASPCAL04278 [Aspergillus calidoustus]|uniref:Apple domain-containing protein n=1 Tax=Aspergillus calidoustus TaxID=454130 RepID=A0A0U5FUB2_ASPCI|nr:hypothetical protein ASPCAL04278 [Aspergillus calidoustus]